VLPSPKASVTDPDCTPVNPLKFAAIEIEFAPGFTIPLAGLTDNQLPPLANTLAE
jgi:hypothetical protein